MERRTGERGPGLSEELSHQCPRLSTVAHILLEFGPGPRGLGQSKLFPGMKHGLQRGSIYVGESSTKFSERGLSHNTGYCIDTASPPNRIGRIVPPKIPSLQTIFTHMEYLSIRMKAFLGIGNQRSAACSFRLIVLSPYARRAI